MNWLQLKQKIESMDSDKLIIHYDGLRSYMYNNPKICNYSHNRVLNIIRKELKNRNLL